ncbi:2-oxoglutarate dehydrogenase, E2 component, dihydrolipoamide succinyltransferase [Klugiella xanthotipulae]|uniref:Dihydrolipoamide acetyltransferase component of pyruvate dehydrogenase complex n=1 Tax=Klugiella xanthotipulae TaxID=244735 RepID=A0A543HS43_9MICO|nr:2-oxoglutarate dehydrogenase, E2 component, dihydrolipoamide succinyltransferase [Klugiella xanthotipulae]TQM61160.1 2-oxoglutarate dehydrogenase E2 component [Klugiella xanthotipulae]
MSESVVLPELGESVTEGTVTRWLKNVGDTVEADEPLLEVSTDKVDIEIPSPFAGVVEEILVQEDETIEVGAVMARIGDGSSATAVPAAEPVLAAVPEPAVIPEPVAVATSMTAPEPVAASVTTHQPVTTPVATATQTMVPSIPAEPVTPPTTSVADTTGPGYVTPIVRKLAHEHGVDLAGISGTGVGGRIRKEDVLATAPVPASTIAPASASVVSELRGTTQKFSRLRKVIAERAVASLQSSAQLTTVVEVDVTELAALRDRMKGEFLTKTGNKLSFLPFFTLAATEALRVYPVLNATVEGDTIVYPEHENISIAVDTERGLLTPVVRDAAGKNIAQLAAEIADLAARTRDNQLKPDELAAGTFTLTNTGSRGALFDTPLVFLPQVAILGTGIVTKRPMVMTAGNTDAVAVRSTVYLALSYDHRIVDGADAARFLGHLKSRLESAQFESDLGI